MSDFEINFSIIVPCYNEEKNIPSLLERFEKVIKSDDIELILVNNGSVDNSKEILDLLLLDHKFARKIDVVNNKGYGYGIKQGLNAAKGKYIGYTHADLQTDPLDVVKAIDWIRTSKLNDHFFIKGNRKGRPVFDTLFTYGMSVFETIYLKKRLWDINAQPTFFPANFYKGLRNIPDDFSLDLYLLYVSKVKKMYVHRFDVFFPPRLNGVSSWNTGLKSKWKFIKRTIQFSINLNKKMDGNNLS